LRRDGRLEIRRVGEPDLRDRHKALNPGRRPAYVPAREPPRAPFVPGSRRPMAHRPVAALAAALVLCAAAFADAPPSGACFADPQAGRQVAAAIADLRKLAGDGTMVTADLKAQGMDQGLATLTIAEQSLAAGRLLLALEKLDQARVLLEPLRYMDPRMEKVRSGGVTELDAALKPLAAELDTLRPELARSSPATLPAAVRAL